MDLLRHNLKMVYNKFHRQLFTMALSITGNRESAEDAIHNTFFNLLKKETMPYDTKLYVFKCVRNAAIDQIRNKKKNISINENFAYIFDPQPDLLENIEDEEFRNQVALTLTKLSDNESETIIQHLYADLTFKEISELTETPIGTVTSWYRRGLQKLKESVKR
jgi:RNA polymerase sigma-70 factor (ECF subfamily)